MSTQTSESSVPRMGAEAGYGLTDTVPPFRVSGYISLILGLLSAAALVGPQALFIPIAAVLFAVFALRKYGEQVPAGIIPARIGLVLAVFFGVCGAGIPWTKSMTLGEQAEKYARDYIEIVALDELELALELRKDYINRFPPTMPLKAHYSVNPLAEDGMIEFRDESVNKSIRARGPGAEWRLARPVRIHSRYGSQEAELLFEDPTGQNSIQLLMHMSYMIDTNGDGQWQILRVMHDSNPIFAPLVL